MLHDPSRDQVQQFVAAGAVESGFITLSNRNWYTREIVWTPWPAIRHFFNAAGTEVGYFNRVTGTVHMFQPPRVWHETLKAVLVTEPLQQHISCSPEEPMNFPNCPEERADCRFVDLGCSMTCMHSPIVRDRNGHLVGGSDNVVKRAVQCVVCQKRWDSAATELEDARQKPREWQEIQRQGSAATPA